MSQADFYIFLQHYWFFLVSLLGALLVFLLFVQGGQTLLFQIGKSEVERTMLVNSLGRKWEFTFTTLVTFGGAFFASFPLFYATSFGGAYWVWILILFAFVIQAISYEYRSKPNNFLGKRTYEVFLFINGAAGTILLGTAVGTFFTGSAFSINNLNQVTWEGPARGLEAVLNYRNVSLGLSVFFLSRVLACLYFLNSINDEVVERRSRRQLLFNAIPFLVFFLTFVIGNFLSKGYALDPATGDIFMEDFKYFKNMVQMPLLGVLFLIGVVAVLVGIAFPFFSSKGSRGIWFAGLGTVLTVLSLLLSVGYNNTAFYPSSHDWQSSLTIYNASSSFFTLKTMSVVSLLVPFVVAYIWYAWRALTLKPIDREEMEASDEHVY